jgi:hypothetical protein
MITEGVTKVYCIQNLCSYYKYDFYKGHYYKVLVREGKYSDIIIYDDNNNIFGFYINSDFNSYLVSDYFLTEKEQRKYKLKKLNEKFDKKVNKETNI